MLAVIFLFSVRGGYYTALSYDDIHDICFVYICEVVWFDTLVVDQSSLALLHFLHIN